MVPLPTNYKTSNIPYFLMQKKYFSHQGLNPDPKKKGWGAKSISGSGKIIQLRYYRVTIWIRQNYAVTIGILHTAFLLNFEYKSSDRRCFIIFSITLRISGLQKKFVFLLFIFASMSIIIEFLSNLRSCPLSQLLGGKTEPIYYRYSLFYTPFSNRRNNFLGKCALLKKNTNQ